jgi:hypothetical protein
VADRAGSLRRRTIVTCRHHSKVNVRIPLSLARAAGKFIPRHAQQHLAAYNINLEEFLSGLSDAEGDRTLVEVKDGTDEVRIAVE